MLKLLKYLRFKDWITIIFILGFVVGQVMLDLELPDYMGGIVNLIQNQATINEI